MRISTYQPLREFLKTSVETEISLSFPRIEEILGRKLPPTAYGNDAWWGNSTAGHSQARAWRRAGFKVVAVNRAAKTAMFKRVPPQHDAPTGTQGMSALQRLSESIATREKKPRRHPAWGALKGTFTIAPDWDITKPAIDPEELAEWEANLDRMADELGKGSKGGSQ